MGEVRDFFEKHPRYAVMAICFLCGNRWFGTVIARTCLFTLECPHCNGANSFASFIPQDYLEEFDDVKN